jgi:hypothetical protein
MERELIRWGEAKIAEVARAKLARNAAEAELAALRAAPPAAKGTPADEVRERIEALAFRWDDDAAKMAVANEIAEARCVGAGGPIRASGATSAACARELRVELAALRALASAPSPETATLARRYEEAGSVLMVAAEAQDNPARAEVLKQAAGVLFFLASPSPLSERTTTPAPPPASDPALGGLRVVTDDGRPCNPIDHFDAAIPGDGHER